MRASTGLTGGLLSDAPISRTAAKSEKCYLHIKGQSARASRTTFLMLGIEGSKKLLLHYILYRHAVFVHAHPRECLMIVSCHPAHTRHSLARRFSSTDNSIDTHLRDIHG